MKVGKLSGWSVLILPWLTLVTAKVYQVLSKISAHSKSILWLLLHWDCSISQYHIQSKMFDDFVFFDGKRWWQFARISILRIEKRLIIERKCYLRFIMTLRRFFFHTLCFSMYSNFTLHFDIFGDSNQRVLVHLKRYFEQTRVLEWQKDQLLIFGVSQSVMEYNRVE